MQLGRGFTAARRQASRLAGLAGGDPLHPGLRAVGAQERSGKKQLGRGFTAARRQASRLAGLVRFPASWQVHTAIRRRASWLAKKASVVSNPRWPFALQEYTSYIEIFHPARGKPAPRRLREKENQPIHLRCKNPQTTPQRPTPQGVSLPTANCGGAERR